MRLIHEPKTRLLAKNIEMSQKRSIACAILAGGRSKRFGSNKALALYRGQRLIDVIIKKLSAQTSGTIVINAPSPEPYGLISYEFAPDLVTKDIGPLAGLHAVLSWAKQNKLHSVITTPVDTPTLPDSFVDRLVSSGPPSIATYNGQIHPLHGIWPVAQAELLDLTIANGMRAVREWTSVCGAKECAFPKTESIDPFFNVNTPNELNFLAKTQKRRSF